MDFVVAETADEALELAREKSGKNANHQGSQTCDKTKMPSTHGSLHGCGLFLCSMVSAIPNNEEIQYYYPTSDLVTGPDIIFFWVARMIMAGYEYTGKMPFKNVYFTGIVRDKLGRKMSKSLGNSSDPLDLIDRFGADGVRMGMMLGAPAGNDILFDEALCEQGRNFCNKIWNAFRLVQGWNVDTNLSQPETARLAVEWLQRQITSKRSRNCRPLYKIPFERSIDGSLPPVLGRVLKLVPRNGEARLRNPSTPVTYQAVLAASTTCSILLHPFMPFITEATLATPNRNVQARIERIMVIPQTIEQPQAANAELLATSSGTPENVVTGVRANRNLKTFLRRRTRPLQVVGSNPYAAFNALTIKMAGISGIEVVESKGEGASSFMVGTSEFAVLLGGRSTLRLS